MAMDFESFGSILSEEEMDNLFADDNDTQDIPQPEENEGNNDNKDKSDKTELETTEVNEDELFDSPESVSGGEKQESKKDTTSDKDSTSPNFYSSIAKALKEDSIFPDLNPDEITDADSFAELFDKQVQARLDEKIKRFDEAVSSGVNPSVAGQYEKSLNQLQGITEESIKDESNEELRKQLIYLDLINKSYTKEEAEEEIADILENGTDVKRAEKALRNNINFYQKKYQEEIDKAKAESARLEEENKTRAESIKKAILNESKFLGDITVPQALRQKAFDAISKPIYTTKEGQRLTALQKYEAEHREDYLKNISLFYVLTDGFTKTDSLVREKLNKESKKAIRELENTLNNTRRTSDGNLKFVSNVDEDPESFLNGLILDV